MAASRSRTQEWRRCLAQLKERNGGLEIAVAPNDRDHHEPGDLIWRVRVLSIDDHEIVVENPMALGTSIQLEVGVALIAVLVIGQNRWMFRTQVLGPGPRHAHGYGTLRVVMPQAVERCQRRHHYRVETASLELPNVDVWPLLDPRSVVVAERANELAIESGIGTADEDMLLPTVGPRISAALQNVGGGGVGLLLQGSDAAAFGRHRIFWMRIRLPETEPVCATGKVVHTHLDSLQNTYAGIAFDFTFNPSHHRFVQEQICRYIAVRQRDQMRRSA